MAAAKFMILKLAQQRQLVVGFIPLAPLSTLLTSKNIVPNVLNANTLCSNVYAGLDGTGNPQMRLSTFYTCQTCQQEKKQDQQGQEGVCIVCKNACHKNHTVTGPYYGDFYCDCKTGECKRRPLTKAAASATLVLPIPHGTTCFPLDVTDPQCLDMLYALGTGISTHFLSTPMTTTTTTTTVPKSFLVPLVPRVVADITTLSSFLQGVKQDNSIDSSYGAVVCHVPHQTQGYGVVAYVHRHISLKTVCVPLQTHLLTSSSMSMSTSSSMSMLLTSMSTSTVAVFTPWTTRLRLQLKLLKRRLFQHHLQMLVPTQSDYDTKQVVPIHNRIMTAYIDRFKANAKAKTFLRMQDYLLDMLRVRLAEESKKHALVVLSVGERNEEEKEEEEKVEKEKVENKGLGLIQLVVLPS